MTASFQHMLLSSQRQIPGFVPSLSLRAPTGQDAVAVLERLRYAGIIPQRIYRDNDSEFVSAAMGLR